jgi:PleD family two-component response regulator
VPGSSADRPIRCTVTIGVAAAFTGSQAFDESMQQADAALYRGKAAGRNRVEWVGDMSFSVSSANG